jgi:CubicO group peptidase (beta-lactamase class C family)
MKTLKSIIILMSVVAIQACHTKDPRAGQIDALCSSIFPQDGPGAAVLVLEKEKVIFEKGYGLADMDTKAPIDGNTSFNIASVSKQFTAIAILQLVQEGKLKLTDSVAQFFPEFRYALWKEVRIKDLLSHSSGVPDERGYLTREQKIVGDEELATEYMKDLDHLHFLPGSAYEYINPTYVLLGKIVERVSGEPFTEYVDRHIFTPAGMDRTVYFDRDRQDLIPSMAHGYEYADDTGKWNEYDFGEETFFATRPDGGIYTSVREFVKWEKALRDNMLLGQELTKDAMSPHTLVSGSPWSDYQNRPNTWYGYGWFIEPVTESTPLRVYHTGDNGGFKIMAARYPEQDVLILVFANRSDWDRYALLLAIEGIVLPASTE